MIGVALALLRLVNALVARADAAALRQAGSDAALRGLYEAGLRHVARAHAVDAALDGADPDWVRRVRERHAGPGAGA